MTGAEINLALAQHVLRNVLSNDERVVTIEVIQKFVADYFQLRPNELKSRNNSKSIALPRQVAMYMCKALTRASLPEIGKAFGGKHHSTVIHSIQKIDGMRQRDAEFSALHAEPAGEFPVGRPTGPLSHVSARRPQVPVEILRADCGPAEPFPAGLGTHRRHTGNPQPAASVSH